MGFAVQVTGKGFRLAAVDPAADGGLTEAEGTARLERLSAELLDLQELAYAAEENGILVMLHGMDASGKDVTIRHTFHSTNPQSCRVKAFKEMSPEEEKHDFLWRAHGPAAARGELVIYDRSYYEQTLIPAIRGELSEEEMVQRREDVVGFERILLHGRTILIKVFLHVGYEEQGRRLEERQRDPATAWKISANDWQARREWDAHMAGWEATINATATPEAPWFVVPADHQWFHNLAVAEVLVDCLRPYRQRWLDARVRRGEEKRAEAEEARDGG